MKFRQTILRTLKKKLRFTVEVPQFQLRVHNIVIDVFVFLFFVVVLVVLSLVQYLRSVCKMKYEVFFDLRHSSLSFMSCSNSFFHSFWKFKFILHLHTQQSPYMLIFFYDLDLVHDFRFVC